MLTAGTLGGTTGLTLLVGGCLVEVAAEGLAVEDLCESANGLISEAEAEAEEGAEAKVRAGVPEAD